MKYAVIGIGAVGSIVGGLLAKSGEDVTLIGKPYQIDVINQKGLKIIDVNGTTILKDIKISKDLLLVKDVDIVFICVKSQDTKQLANDLKNILNKSTLIISLQNGVKNAQVLKDITGNKVLSGVVLFNALYEKPGEVTLTIRGRILLEKNKENLDILVKSFYKAGLKITLVDGIDGYLWSKLILNLQIAVTALTGQTIRQSIANKDTKNIIVATMKEGINVVQKSNIKLEVLPEVDPKKMIKRFSSLGSFFLIIGSSLIGIKKDARNSMWQSLSQGKQTEIDFINGEIITLAKKYKMQAPINKKIVELIKKAEQQHQLKTYEPQELKKILNVS